MKRRAARRVKNRKVRIIFLDMDGVVSPFAHFKRMIKASRPRSAYQGWSQMIEERAVARLNRIVLATGAQVVISSSWRKSHPLPRLRRMLRKKGFVGQVIGATPVHRGEFRGPECVAWLAASRLPVFSFVVLDDEPHDFELVGDRLILTSSKKSDGLLDTHVRRAIALLEVGDEERIAQWRATATQQWVEIRRLRPDPVCRMPSCYSKKMTVID